MSRFLLCVSVLVFAAGGAAVGSLFLVGHIPSWVVGFAGACAALYGGAAQTARRPMLTLLTASLPVAFVALWGLFGWTEFELSPIHALVGALGMAPILVIVFALPVRVASRARIEGTPDARRRALQAAAIWLGIVAGASAIASATVDGAGSGGLTSATQGLSLALGALIAAATLAGGVARPSLRWRAAAIVLIEGAGAAVLIHLSIAHLEPLSGMTEVKLGGHHACARHRDGFVVCWGARADGTDRGQRSPAVIEGIDDALQIDAEGDITCALRRSGEVACWEGARSGKRIPAPIHGLPPARRIVLGGGRGCALTRGDEIVCWSSDRTRWSTIPLGTSVGVTDLLVDSWGGCRLTVDGLACWDRSDGDQTAEGVMPACLRAPKGKNEAPLMAGSLLWGRRSACGVTREGAVRCFGTTVHTTIGPPRCADAMDLPGIAGVRSAVFISFYEVCGIDTNGNLRCWDADGSGREVVLTDVVDASSSVATCAVRSDGSVWCWGPNHHGQFGDGTRRARRGPVPVRR